VYKPREELNKSLSKKRDIVNSNFATRVKIVFFGNEQLAQGLASPITPTFDSLINSDHDIVALVLPRKPNSVSRNKKELKIIARAEAQNIIVIYADQMDNLDEVLLGLNADIGILVSYGKIVPQKIIDVFPHGIINIHPSLLPKYRGPSPIETTIMKGDNTTGVSLMALSAKMDAGPIYAQAEVVLDGTETKPTLYEKLSTVGSKLLIDNIDKIIAGGLKPTPQNDTHAAYTQLLTKSDGLLDPATMTATECERKIRAFVGFPRTRLNFHGREVIITSAKVLPGFAGDKWPDIIKCADNTFLQINELISPTSGKTMKTSDYFRGLPQRKINGR
jgi:methionyl-tRNA formyltransferase